MDGNFMKIIENIHGSLLYFRKHVVVFWLPESFLKFTQKQRLDR